MRHKVGARSGKCRDKAAFQHAIGPNRPLPPIRADSNIQDKSLDARLISCHVLSVRCLDIEWVNAMWYGSTGRKRIRRFCLGGTAVVLALTTAACSSASSSSSSSAATAANGAPRAGGSLTVLEATGYSGDWPDGLDPATNIDGAADQDYMDAIYGELFELGPKGAITPDLATGYSISTDAKTITLNIRPGVTFTDGTPFNAAAVVWNIDRDLKSACTCKPTWPVTSVTATGTDTVVIKLSAPDGAFIDEIFDSTADWIASPTAVQKMGEKAFAVSPVGAGPFVVVSDTLSSALVLKRNPGYWQKGRPYLEEQSYCGVDGDSASSTEIYALLSALAGLPIRQDIAVTGSVSQQGDIQPIGQRKPKNRRLLRCLPCQGASRPEPQGVMIPSENIEDLMLRDDVIDAVVAR